MCCLNIIVNIGIVSIMTKNLEDSPNSVLKKYQPPRTLVICEMDTGKGACSTGLSFTESCSISGNYAGSCGEGNAVGSVECSDGSTNGAPL